MTTRVHPLPGPFVIVIFGAGGDLTRRKLIPALYNLYLGDWLPEKFAIIGIDRKNQSDEEFRQNLRAEGVDEFSRRGKAEDKPWAEFAARMSHISADFAVPEVYATGSTSSGRRRRPASSTWPSRRRRSTWRSATCTTPTWGARTAATAWSWKNPSAPIWNRPSRSTRD